MTLAGLFRLLLSMGRDPWAASEAWRKRQAERITAQKPTYDAYPDRVEQPDMALYVEARDALGHLLRQRVDLRGYSVNHINFDVRSWRDGLAEAVKSARGVLRARLRLAQIEAEKRAEARRHEAYERAVAREAREKRGK